MKVHLELKSAINIQEIKYVDNHLFCDTRNYVLQLTVQLLHKMVSQIRLGCK